MKKFILKIFGILAVIILAVIYAALFAVFYYDLDGKFIYYIFEPFMVKRFDNMKREDNLKTPYDMKEDVMKEE